MAPRETENNAYAKFWGDKQRALWYVMVFLVWSIAMCFMLENLLKVFGTGQSDVCSGTLMTMCHKKNANIDSGDPGNRYCMTKNGSSYPQIVY